MQNDNDNEKTQIITNIRVDPLLFAAIRRPHVPVWSIWIDRFKH